MQLRCYRCGWSFAITKDEIEFALEALEESHGDHYNAHCPRCKRSNKVSIEQLRRAAPRRAAEDEEEKASVSEEEEPAQAEGSAAAEPQEPEEADA